MSRDRVGWAIACVCAAFACSGTISTVEGEPLGTDLTDPRGGSGGGGSVSVPAAGAGNAASANASGVGGSMAGSAASAGTSSGAEGGSGGATVAGPVCDAVTRVLTAKCGGGSCHSNENSNIGAFARGREEAESMLDKPSSKLGCGFIIDSSNPADSLLLTKVNGTFPDPCGGPMPAPAAGETTELSASDIDCLEDWLQQFQQ